MVVEIVTEEEPEEVSEEETPEDLEIHGDVETIEEGDTTEVEEGDTNVTVIDSDGDAVEAVVTEQVIEDAVTLAVLSERFNAMEARVLGMEAQLALMQVVDEVEAEAVVEVADDLEDLEEEGEELEEEEEEDREPNSAGVHPLFRSWRDMFSRD